jgi:hypothetical protein
MFSFFSKSPPSFRNAPCLSKEQLERGGAAHLSGAEGVLHDPQLPQRADPHPTPGTTAPLAGAGGMGEVKPEFPWGFLVMFLTDYT